MTGQSVRAAFLCSLLLLSLAQLGAAASPASAAVASATPEVLSASDIGLQALVQPLMLQNESFSASAAQISGGRWAYLIYLNATPAAMAVAEQNKDGTYTARLLTQEYEIRPVLGAYYASIGYGELAKKEFSAAHQIMLQMDAKEVKDCKQMMGIDTHACNSYDSCFSACRTSPTCSQLAEGIGKSFVYQLWDYQNRSMVMADAIAKETAQYFASEPDVTLLSISKYKDSLQPVWAAQGSMLSHPYNNWVCKTPFYDSKAPDNVRQHLAAAEKLIISIQGDDNGAQKIANEAARRRALKGKEDGLLGVNAMFSGTGANLLLVAIIGLGAVLVAVVVLAVVANWRKKKDAPKQPDVK